MYWLGSNWVDVCAFAYLVIIYCLCLLFDPANIFIFWFELLRHLFYWFNKWHNHLTNVVFHFTKAVTKTELRKARIDLFIASILKFLYINAFSLFCYFPLWKEHDPLFEQTFLNQGMLWGKFVCNRPSGLGKEILLKCHQCIFATSLLPPVGKGLCPSFEKRLIP